MDTLTHDLTLLLRRHLRTELLRLARAEEDAAADAAATVRYWEHCPSTVAGHRECAAVLRVAADAIDSTRPPHSLPGPGPARG